MELLHLLANGSNGSASVAVNEGETSSPVVIRRGSKNVSIAIHPDAEGGAGKAQFTISPLDKIVADEANWFDWAKGSVTQSTFDVAIGPLTAVRGVCTAGSIVMEVASDA